MNRAKIQAIKGDLADALTAIGEKHGCKVEVKGGRFTDVDVKIPVVFTDTDERAQEKLAELARDEAKLLRLPPDVVGKTFREGPHTYTVKFFRLRRSKPVICAREDGKLYQFSADSVRRLLQVVAA